MTRPEVLSRSGGMGRDAPRSRRAMIAARASSSVSARSSRARCSARATAAPRHWAIHAGPKVSRDMAQYSVSPPAYAGDQPVWRSSMTTVETALGPIPTTELGPTLMHEHIVTRSPGVHENWPHLMDRPGIRTIVDLTTVDLGRDIDLIVDVARRSRVHVIVATGVWWMPQRYFNVHGVDEAAALFVRDITQGIGTSGVKAAIIKCATDTAGVTPVIENVLRASAR